jgi:hypothetical protein
MARKNEDEERYAVTTNDIRCPLCIRRYKCNFEECGSYTGSCKRFVQDGLIQIIREFGDLIYGLAQGRKPVKKAVNK